MIYTIRYPQDAGVKYQWFRYPAGEQQVRFTTNKQISDLLMASDIHVVATIRDGETMGLMLLLDAISGMNRLPALIMPYLPYARGDRRFVPGDCFGLRVLSKMINQTVVCKVVTLDAHSRQSENLINDLVNVSPKPLIDTAISALPGKSAILLPDEGAARYIADLPHVLQCRKKRDVATGKLSGFITPSAAELAGYDSAIIVDDICDGGGTFAGIAENLPHELPLFLYVTHGIFSKGLEPLSSFQRIFTTDSLPQQSDERLTVIPCMGTILDSILPRRAVWENAIEQK